MCDIHLERMNLISYEMITHWSSSLTLGEKQTCWDSSIELQFYFWLGNYHELWSSWLLGSLGNL